MSKFKKFLKENKVTKNLYKVVSKIYNSKYKFMNDEKYAKKIYYKKIAKPLNLENPQTYDEKLWWLKINYHNPLMTMCVDKYWVREYVKICGYEEILNEIYGVYDDVEKIDFSKIEEEKVFFKCNHRSGANMIYDKNKPFDINRFKKDFRKYLNSNYYNLYREWPYKNVRPLIICEKVLTTSEKSGLVDYRMLCFDGKLKYVLLDVDVCAEDGTHAENSKINVYDRDLNLLKNYKFNIPNFESQRIKKPKNYDKMVEIAEKLSKPFPHARVDLYNISGKIIFGEITFFHRGGFNPNISPKAFDKELADSINIEKIKENLNK